MVKRDLIRNILFLLVLGGILILVRVMFLVPYTIKEADSNQYLSTNDLVIALKKEHIDYDDFVLYEIDNKEYVGRVVAMGKDTVEFMDDVFYLNSQPQDEPYLTSVKEKYLASEESTGYYTHDFNLQTLTNSELKAIPKNYYLILNDERRNTKDSRELGLVSEKQIKGILTFRLAPLNKFGFIQTE